MCIMNAKVGPKEVRFRQVSMYLRVGHNQFKYPGLKPQDL